MIDIPQSTIVNRTVPKEKFYTKTAVNTKLRQQFTEEIDKIRWTHKISPDTLNIEAKEYTELQIFEIALKKSDISMSLLKHIDKFIPYPILFIIKTQGAEKAVMSYKMLSQKSEDLAIVDNYFATPWSQVVDFKVQGRSVDEIYSNFLYQIAPHLKTGHTNTKDAVEQDKHKQKIQKQIDAINRKMTSEPSVAKKQELARARYDLEQEL